MGGIAKKKRCRTFGTALTVLFDVYGEEVPQVIRDCVRRIEREADIEGLFILDEIPPYTTQVQALKKQCEKLQQGSISSLFPNVHAAAGLLKTFLQDLPEPVIVLDLHDDFTEAINIEADETEKYLSIQNLVSCLPHVHKMLFGYLITFFHRVSELSGRKPAELGGVFGPILMRSNNRDGKVRATGVKVVTMLIDKYSSHMKKQAAATGSGGGARASIRVKDMQDLNKALLKEANKPEASKSGKSAAATTGKEEEEEDSSDEESDEESEEEEEQPKIKYIEDDPARIQRVHNYPCTALIPGVTVKSVRALYAFASRREEELNLQAGDIIEVTYQDPNGPTWWSGKIGDAKPGLFPANYCEVYEILKPKPRKELRVNQNKITNKIFALQQACFMGGSRISYGVDVEKEKPQFEEANQVSEATAAQLEAAAIESTSEDVVPSVVEVDEEEEHTPSTSEEVKIEKGDAPGVASKPDAVPKANETSTPSSTVAVSNLAENVNKQEPKQEKPIESSKETGPSADSGKGNETSGAANVATTVEPAAITSKPHTPSASPAMPRSFAQAPQQGTEKPISPIIAQLSGRKARPISMYSKFSPQNSPLNSPSNEKRKSTMKLPDVQFKGELQQFSGFKASRASIHDPSRTGKLAEDIALSFQSMLSEVSVFYKADMIASETEEQELIFADEDESEEEERKEKEKEKKSHPLSISSQGSSSKVTEKVEDGKVAVAASIYHEIEQLKRELVQERKATRLIIKSANSLREEIRQQRAELKTQIERKENLVRQAKNDKNPPAPEEPKAEDETTDQKEKSGQKKEKKKFGFWRQTSKPGGISPISAAPEEKEKKEGEATKGSWGSGSGSGGGGSGGSRFLKRMTMKPQKSKTELDSGSGSSVAKEHPEVTKKPSFFRRMTMKPQKSAPIILGGGSDKETEPAVPRDETLSNEPKNEAVVEGAGTEEIKSDKIGEPQDTPSVEKSPPSDIPVTEPTVQDESKENEKSKEENQAAGEESSTNKQEIKDTSERSEQHKKEEEQDGQEEKQTEEPKATQAETGATAEKDKENLAGVIKDADNEAEAKKEAKKEEIKGAKKGGKKEEKKKGFFSFVSDKKKTKEEEKQKAQKPRDKGKKDEGKSTQSKHHNESAPEPKDNDKDKDGITREHAEEGDESKEASAKSSTDKSDPVKTQEEESKDILESKDNHQKADAKDPDSPQTAGSKELKEMQPQIVDVKESTESLQTKEESESKSIKGEEKIGSKDSLAVAEVKGSQPITDAKEPKEESPQKADAIEPKETLPKTDIKEGDSVQKIDAKELHKKQDSKEPKDSQQKKQAKQGKGGQQKTKAKESKEVPSKTDAKDNQKKAKTKESAKKPEAKESKETLQKAASQEIKDNQKASSPKESKDTPPKTQAKESKETEELPQQADSTKNAQKKSEADGNLNVDPATPAVETDAASKPSEASKPTETPAAAPVAESTAPESKDAHRTAESKSSKEGKGKKKKQKERKK